MFPLWYWAPGTLPTIVLVEILLYACDFSEFLCTSHGGIWYGE
jgi:hypothetical protein